MISRSTPPGTEIVCVRSRPVACNGWLLGDVSHLLVEGQAYRLEAISPCFCTGLALVDVQGISVGSMQADGCGFHLARFRRAQLPESLTSLFNIEPTEGREGTRQPASPDLQPVTSSQRGGPALDVADRGGRAGAFLPCCFRSTSGFSLAAASREATDFRFALTRFSTFQAARPIGLNASSSVSIQVASSHGDQSTIR